MTRWEILNAFIAARGYTSFLEIGTDRGETFRHITCHVKVSVDPDPSANATFVMTSDDFFRQNKDRFDVIFIDGLHTKDQAIRDAVNALARVTAGGIIVMHDCLPSSYLMQLPMEHPESSVIVRNHHAWTGDVWRAFLYVRMLCNCETYVIDDDLGCGIIDVGKQRVTPIPDNMPDFTDVATYTEWLLNRNDWMNVRTWKSVQEELEKEGEDNERKENGQAHI